MDRMEQARCRCNKLEAWTVETHCWLMQAESELLTKEWPVEAQVQLAQSESNALNKA